VKNRMLARFPFFLTERSGGTRGDSELPPFAWIQNPARIFAG